MKDTKSRRVDDESSQKYYNPDARLVDWFAKRLILEQERKRSKGKGKTRDKPSNRIYKELKDSGARKAEILDKIIFPAMTDLIYFFEAIEMSPTLKNLFEKDVKKLLDTRFSKRSAEFPNLSMRFSTSIQFKNNNLFRLLSNALSLDFGESGIEHDTRNFRLGLLYQIQGLILDIMDGVFSKEYDFHSQISKSALQDYNRAVGWLAFIAKSVSDEKIEQYDKSIGFMPITYSNKGNLSTLKL